MRDAAQAKETGHGAAPSLPRWAVLVQRLSQLANRALAWLAGTALVAMMLLTVADMALRAYGRPLAGSYEMIGWLAAVAVALALGYTQVHRGHVSIDLALRHLPAHAAKCAEVATRLVSLALFIAVAFYVFRYGGVLQETGSLSETLKAIVFPWVYLVAVGVAGLALALLADLLCALARVHGASRGSR
ncbi:MAG: TRAP transporter small permease [Burkholderiaceae bacterium]|nr:TRAP transporter small permease [Burkholderiaceae bacterium]